MSLMQGMFALGRLVSVLLATKFSPAFMLLCNIVRIVGLYTYTMTRNKLLLGLPCTPAEWADGDSRCVGRDVISCVCDDDVYACVSALQKEKWLELTVPKITYGIGMLHSLTPRSKGQRLQLGLDRLLARVCMSIRLLKFSTCLCNSAVEIPLIVH